MKNITCPFCKFEAESFLPGGLEFDVLNKYKIVGGGFRKNKFCPNCKSNDRNRHVYLYSLLFTSLFSNKTRKKVLHIAPEICLMKKIKDVPKLAYYSIDLNGRNNSRNMDLRNTSFKGNKFDFIICSHVLEHIVEDKRAIGELFRIIKNKGTLLLTVPYSRKIKKSFENAKITDPKDREKYFGQHDHVRIYSEWDILHKLTQCGFRVKCINLSDELGQAFASRFALLMDEKIFVCSKRREFDERD